MMKPKIKLTLKFSGLLILAALTLAACSLPIQEAATNQSDSATVETSSPVVDPTSIPISEEEIQNEILPEEAEEIELTDAEVEQETVEEPGSTIGQEITDEGFTGITDTEKASLIFMREEEKLAHDVYLALYDLWGLPLFQNIASSEETHTNAVKRLLDTFNIPDPALDTAPGVFTDPVLQKLYDELIAQGERSLADALKVGGAVEEIDILDLQAALDETENPEIQRVFQNLLRGSENHLRAFTSTLLQQTGETYIPQYLDVSAYDGILASAPARGGRVNNRRP
ncbi:MAG: DUF2202 domain-containing protein [Brevefilum sp.]|nr:DUF2202 domain-containing protein [Brevefilum sp.]